MAVGDTITLTTRGVEQFAPFSSTTSVKTNIGPQQVLTTSRVGIRKFLIKEADLPPRRVQSRAEVREGIRADIRTLAIYSRT